MKMHLINYKGDSMRNILCMFLFVALIGCGDDEKEPNHRSADARYVDVGSLDSGLDLDVSDAEVIVDLSVVDSQVLDLSVVDAEVVSDAEVIVDLSVVDAEPVVDQVVLDLSLVDAEVVSDAEVLADM